MRADCYTSQPIGKRFHDRRSSIRQGIEIAAFYTTEFLTEQLGREHATITIIKMHSNIR